MSSQLLRSVKFFATLEDKELELLVAKAATVRYREGHFLVKQDELQSTFFVIAEGKAQVSRRGKTGPIVLAELGPGSFFGEINLFEPGTATADVKTLSNGIVIRITHELFQQYLTEQPAAACKILSEMLAEMSRRLRQANQQLTDAVYWAGKS